MDFILSVLIGLRGDGLRIPVDAGWLLDPRAQHQAFRRPLLVWALQLEGGTQNKDDGEALAAMKHSLQDRQHVLERSRCLSWRCLMTWSPWTLSWE